MATLYVAYYNGAYNMWYPCIDPSSKDGDPMRNGPWEPAKAMAVMSLLKAKQPWTSYALVDRAPDVLNRWDDEGWSKV